MFENKGVGVFKARLNLGQNAERISVGVGLNVTAPHRPASSREALSLHSND
jgi:hypothetical protein